MKEPGLEAMGGKSEKTTIWVSGWVLIGSGRILMDLASQPQELWGILSIKTSGS